MDRWKSRRQAVNWAGCGGQVFEGWFWWAGFGGLGLVGRFLRAGFCGLGFCGLAFCGLVAVVTTVPRVFQGAAPLFLPVP